MKTPRIAPHRLDYQIGNYALQAIIAGAVVLALFGIVIWLDWHDAATSEIAIEAIFCTVLDAFIWLRIVQVLRLLKQVREERNNGTPQS
ncbi:MAG: hypothetical protein ACXWQ5_00880 [Ktedonobacterales bacterium]